MATEVLSGGVGEIRALSTAAGGTALSTTAVYIQVPPNTNHLYITPRNLATAVVAQFSLNPWLTVLKTANYGFSFTDYSNYAQDGVAANVVALYALDTIANGDSLLIGSHLPFRGVRTEMTATVNGAGSTLLVYYRKSGGTWADTSATDGTSGFSTDGLTYWTVPTDWIPARLVDIFSGAYLADVGGTFTGSPIALKPGSNTVACSVAGTANCVLPAGAHGWARTDTCVVAGSPQLLAAGANTITTTGAAGDITVEITGPPCTGANVNIPLYWTQWQTDIALDSATAESMVAANRSTAYAELLEGQCFETKVHAGLNGVGCVEALVNAGTGNLIVNGASARNGGF